MVPIIDIESDVFNVISTKLRATYSDIWVTGEAADLPAKFPAATITEEDNSIVQSMRTLNIENAANLMYEVNVYSNKAVGKKQEAKQIMQTINREFAKMNFTRTMCNPISNLQDSTIYRIVARYTARVDRDLSIYQS